MLALLNVLLATAVAPVAAHPLSEVTIVVLLIVQDDGGEKPERQFDGRCWELLTGLLWGGSCPEK